MDIYFLMILFLHKGQEASLVFSKLSMQILQKVWLIKKIILPAF